MATLEAGAPAPEFALPDVAGQWYILFDVLRRGPVLLAFWKTGCATTRLAFPYLERLRQAYPQESWQLWAVGQDPKPDVERFLGRVGAVSFPLLVDYPGYVIARRYDPVATPTLFYVEPNGTIAMTAAGFSKQDLNVLSERIATHVGARPVVIAPPDDGNPPFKPG